MPVAVTVSDEPTFTVLAEGVTVRLESVGGGGPGAVTVKTVVPEIEPSCALIVLVPAAIVVARPVLLIVAVAVLLDDHVGEAHGWLEPSVKPQVAMNWNVLPATTLGLAGVTEIVDRTAVQVCVVVATLRPSLVALTVADPVPTQSNSSVAGVPAISPTLRTLVESLEFHTAAAVTG